MLSSEKGTFLEPFQLEGSELELACLCVQAWSSDHVSQPSIRIVGRDCLSTSGGLVIRRDHSTSYLERFAHSKGEPSWKHPQFIAPGLIAEPNLRFPRALDRSPFTLRVESPGARIELESDPRTRLDMSCLREMQDSGNVLELELTFAKIGLRVEQRAGKVTLLTGSAESWIRLAALCERRAQVRIDANLDEDTKILWMFRLEPVSRDCLELPGVRAELTTGSFAWADLDLPPINPGRRALEAVARWTRPHISWQHTIEGMLE